MDTFQLSETEIKKLISCSTISAQYPWNSNNLEIIEKFYLDVCDAVEEKTNCLSKKEFDSYGSGYASFYDAWFYQDTPKFKVATSMNYDQYFSGLVVLFSQLSPFYVFMQGENCWYENGGFSYLPDSTMVDKLENCAVSELAKTIEPILNSYGLIRLTSEQLNIPLQGTWKIPTILSTTDEYMLFDALFFWED
ncbi:hypothetical protein [Acinetobacter gerneri]|uniref:hypothetical protein n=1 Tax=Acinetobacter gerneri TaxID=202952 RepID=UPI0023F355A8|nr:hypothetical protein [Acinetobacter gerneri]MCH4245643.1 hypothetical protein [Acinetobacter gerneri]